MSGDSEEKRLYLIRAEKVPKKCKSRPLLQKRGIFITYFNSVLSIRPG